MDKPTLLKQLKRDEGLRLKMYRDELNVPTIGYGHNLENPITDRAASVILMDDLEHTLAQLDKRIPWWHQLNDARQNALANMAFQLGVHGLLGFTHMLQALKEGDWHKAQDEALNSRWATQVSGRARRIANVFLTGKM